MFNKKIGKRFFTIIILFLLFLISLYSVSKLANARIKEESEFSIKWWDNDWTECQGINIYNPGNSLLNYSIPINLKPENFDYSLGQTDGSDIRFLHNNNYSVLNYWIEDWNYLGTSKIWVEISYIESHDLITIYMYYGNALASSYSNGSLMFEFFDDFSAPLETNKWNIIEFNDDHHNLTVEDGKLHVYAETNDFGFFSGYNFEAKLDFDLNNFEIYMSSSWYNMFSFNGDDSQWNGIILNDEDGNSTGAFFGQRDSYQNTYHTHNDGQQTFNDITEINNGTSYFAIKNSGNENNISLSGRYNYDINMMASNFSLPFTAKIVCMLGGNDSPISMDVYFDYFFIRKTTNNLEPEINFIQPPTSSVTWMPYSLLGICLIILAVYQKRKRK